jgi:hypothetical protein
VLVIDEVLVERRRQDERWGEQNHPDVDQVLMTRPGGCSPQRMAAGIRDPERDQGEVHHRHRCVARRVHLGGDRRRGAG